MRDEQFVKHKVARWKRDLALLRQYGQSFVRILQYSEIVGCLSCLWLKYVSRILGIYIDEIVSVNPISRQHSGCEMT